MSDLGQYVYRVIVAAVFTSVLLAVTPGKGTIAAVIRLSAGVFLLLSAVSPIANSTGNYFLDSVTDIETEADHIIVAAQESRDSEIALVIKERTEAYISDMASGLGANLQVEIAIQTKSPYLPLSIIISGAVSPLTKQRLTSVIEKDLGIPEESQIWKLA